MIFFSLTMYQSQRRRFDCYIYEQSFMKVKIREINFKFGEADRIKKKSTTAPI